METRAVALARSEALKNACSPHCILQHQKHTQQYGTMNMARHGTIGMYASRAINIYAYISYLGMPHGVKGDERAC